MQQPDHQHHCLPPHICVLSNLVGFGQPHCVLDKSTAITSCLVLVALEQPSLLPSPRALSCPCKHSDLVCCTMYTSCGNAQAQCLIALQGEQIAQNATKMRGYRLLCQKLGSCQYCKNKVHVCTAADRNSPLTQHSIVQRCQNRLHASACSMCSALHLGGVRACVARDGRTTRCFKREANCTA